MGSVCHINVLDVSKVSSLTSGVSRKGHVYWRKPTLSAAGLFKYVWPCSGQQQLKG